MTDRKTGAKILSGVVDPESQGSEVIGGVSTTRITGTIPPEIAKIMDPAAKKSSRLTVWTSEDGWHRAVQTLVDPGPG
jgi:lipoprotein LprG